MSFNLKQYLKTNKELIDIELNRYLPNLNEKPSKLHEAMRYSVLSNGKRIRPILMLETYKAFAGTKNVYPAALSLELVHCFSLIHDDLPTLDNDDFRRGIPTCHKKFGNAMALLAGDALLAHSFYLISTEQSKYTHSDKIVKLIQELSTAASTYGITGGQVYDIMAEKGLIEHNEENLKYIHKYKTGSLIKAAIRMGAILADASEQELKKVSKAAENVGLAFQIKDDVLDVVGDQQTLGKTIGRDKELGKLTYVSIFGMENAISKYQELLKEALQLISFLGAKAETINNLFSFIVNRQY